MKRAALLAAALLLAGSLPAGAQRSGAQLTVTPLAGVHLSAVPFRKTVALADDFTLRYRYGFRPAPVFGVAVGIAADALPFGLRAQVGSAPELTLEDEMGPPVYPYEAPPRPNENSVTTGTILMVLQPASLCRGVLCPRALLGGGLKRYRFSTAVLRDDVVEDFAESQTRPTLQLGAGVTARLGRARLVAEASDFTNRIEFLGGDGDTGWVHEVQAMLGVELRAP